MKKIEIYRGYAIYYHYVEDKYFVRGTAQIYTTISNARRGIDRLLQSKNK